MRRPEKESNVTCEIVVLLMPGTQLTAWSCDDGMPFPNLHNEPDLDDLYPECDVTKQFWRNLYRGIERWRPESNFSP
jgi:hypothetical protein